MDRSTPNKQSDPVSLLWSAPVRPHKKTTPYTVRLLFLFGILFSLIFLFLNDKLLIVGVWAIVFAVYVWMKTPPLVVENKITNFGIYWYGDIIPFSSLYAFTVEKKGQEDVLKIFLSQTAYSHLSLVLPSDAITRNRIITYLHEQIPYVDNPPRSGLERFSGGMARLFGFS